MHEGCRSKIVVRILDKIVHRSMVNRNECLLSQHLFIPSSSDSSAPLQIGSVDLKSSYPIQIKPGAVISASGSYRNSYEARPETVFRIDVKVERKILWGYTSVTGLISKHM